MTLLRPSSDQERWRVLAARVGGKRDAPLFAAKIGDWRTVTLPIRCAFFALGAVAAAMTLLIIELLHVPHSLFVSGIVLIAAAEWFIVRQRLVASGIEEALETCGLLMLLFAALNASGSSREVEWALLAAVAFVIAGLRLLNPLFTTLAAVSVSFAIASAMAPHSVERSSGAAIAASVFCFVVALTALAFGGIRFQRPSYDRMLDWLVVSMPLTGYLWSAGGHMVMSSPVDYLHKHAFTDLLTPLEPCAFGFIALAAGISRRKHAPLLAFILCIACVAFELRGLTGWSLVMRLIIWGSVTLGVAVALDRYLRTPRAGITSEKLTDREGPLSLLQLAGSAVITPQGQPREAAPDFQAGGGHFGGGGASGRY